MASCSAPPPDAAWQKPVQFTETLGLSGSFLVWSIFGALFVGALLTHDLSAQPVLYAISQPHGNQDGAGSDRAHRERICVRPTLAFMGWFGPRGLASVVFTLLALEEIDPSGGGGMLLQTVTWTILLSVVLHGISASPLAARYGASISKAGDIPEKAPQVSLRSGSGNLRDATAAKSSTHE